MKGPILSGGKGTRLRPLTIGRNVGIHRTETKPAAFRFVLRDNSEAGIRW